MRRSFALIVPAVLFGMLFFSPGVHAAPLNPANIIVSWSGYPSSFVQEYTPTGTLVQSWTITSTFSTEHARDLGVDNAGNIIIYNGSASPFLTILNPSTGAKTNYSFPGWNTTLSVIDGGLAVWKGYAFASDQEIGPDSANQNGIVRFDLSNGSAQRFRVGIDPTALSIGLNDRLYAIWPNTSPGQNRLDILDPLAMTLIKTINLPFSLSGATADADGNIYGCAGSFIYKMDEAGSVLASLDTHVPLANIKIIPTGQLIMANNGGGITFSNINLNSSSGFWLNEPNAQLYATYAAFATNVPEPAWGLASAMISAVALSARFARRRR